MNKSITIAASGLSKSFDGVPAVTGLDLRVGRGELYGLVGPDGAGKTTALRMLAGIMEATSGDAMVAGRSVRSDAEGIKERIGYMSQRFGLYEDLTVMENILFYADLYEVPPSERPSRIGRLLEFSDLAPFQKRLAGALSGGMKQKLGLCCALIHTPEVLLLDEPTNGVDPVSRRDFWKILYDLLRQGVTVLVSTSYLDEAERCTRIGLMHKGRILIEDDPQKVRRSLGMPMIEIWPDQVKKTREIAGTLPGVRRIGMYGDRLHLGLVDESSVTPVLDGLRREGITVKDHRRILPSLEDVFIDMVEKQAGEIVSHGA